MSDQLMIRLDPELKKQLDRLSRSEGKTTSRMVRELIRGYIKERDIAAYVDGLWERIGKKLGTRGVRPAGVAKAVAEARKGRP
jgi:predicted DNA-binding protein